MAARGVLRTLDDGKLAFVCPGCGCFHAVGVGAGPGPRWGWNGSYETPTFTPSILVRSTEWPTDDEHAAIMRGERVEPRAVVCHSFVTDGRIQFLGDCTHSLANQTVALAADEDA